MVISRCLPLGNQVVTVRVLSVLLVLVIAASLASPAFSQTTVRGSRPAYVYDRADAISSEYESLIDRYLRGLDDATTSEIVVYTIPSFIGHGIKKDNVEIHDRDMLANYIFNEVELDGIVGIGKKGKDNGILVLMSLERDVGGGSLRIEIGRGLEGIITDGTAGEILDSYLVPAREEYESTGSTAAFDKAFLSTVVSLGLRMGYQTSDSNIPVIVEEPAGDEGDIYVFIAILVLFIVFGILVAKYGKGRRYGRYYGGWGGGFRGGGGGGFGGGGGGSGGGGAGR